MHYLLKKGIEWDFELKLKLLHMQVHPKGRIIHKGINPEVDSYSAFFDNAKLGKTSLDEMIKGEEVTDVYVCGIATDVCVGNYLQGVPEKTSLLKAV